MMSCQIAAVRVGDGDRCDLVFVGGRNDRNFRAFHAKTGEFLCKHKTRSGTQSRKFQATYDPIDVTRRLFEFLSLSAEYDDASLLASLRRSSLRRCHYLLRNSVSCRTVL